MISLSEDNRNHPVQVDAIHLPVIVQVASTISVFIWGIFQQLPHHNINIGAIDRVVSVKISDCAT